MDIIAVIFGGFLAAGTGWFVQTRLEASRLKKVKELLLIGMSDDLKNSLELYDRLEEDWKKSRIIWFTTINELTESRHIYTNNKDWITLIKNEDLRKDILQYYRKSANHLVQLQNAQQRKYDIQNLFNLLVQELRMRNPSLELKEAQDNTATTMANESNELTYLDQQIPDLVRELARYKASANDILEKLKSE